MARIVQRRLERKRRQEQQTKPQINNLEYELKVAGKAYKNFWLDESRWVILYGGAGSAKSYTTGQKILNRLLTEDNHRFLICRKVARTLRVSVFQLFKDLIATYPVQMQKYFKINKSDMTITYLPNNSQLIFFGLDDIEKLKSIQGITGIWIEEASECDEGDISELNRRLRGATKYYKQIIITFNPISHLHWLKARFFDNPNSKAIIYKTTYKDNRFIDAEYIAELEEMKHYDLQQYNIYALGEWGVLNTNIIYHNFKHDKHTTQLTVNDFDNLHIGVDFNVGGCVGVVCGIRDNKVHVVDAFAVHDTEAIVSKLYTYQGKNITLYPDSSGKNETANASRSNIQILRDGGFYCDMPKANPAIRDRVNSVNRLFALDQLFINDRVEKVIYALQIHCYTDKGLPEKFTEHVGGAIDDYNDALGYFINQKFGILKGRFGNVKIKYS